MNARATTPERGSSRDMTALVAAARLGNSEASAALWQRCCVVAQRVARRWAGSGADADDLSQEALLRVVESIDGLRNPAALNSWLHVIVARSVARRVRHVRHNRELTVAVCDPECLPSGDPLPDFQVDLRRLLDTLSSLPEEEGRCFWLRRCEGLGISEIARETALSRSTIHRRLSVVERRLAKRLREPGSVALAAGGL